MYCTNCGKQIPNDSLFCTFCGGKIVETYHKERPVSDSNVTNTTTHSENNYADENDKQNEQEPEPKDLIIDIPGISGSKKLVFSDNSLSYNNIEIKYTDIEGISCKQIYHSMNLVPTHQEFSFVFYGINNRININFGTTLHIGKSSRKEIFNKLYVISKRFLAPIIIRKLVTDLIDKNKTINIGNVYFTKEGYYKKAFLGFGEDKWVRWTDNIGEPGMESGNIILYRSDGNKYKHFSSIPLETCNALIVPDLVTAMYSIRNDS